MTLTIAIQLDDYIILTGDQRLIVECESFTQLPAKTIYDGYKKIKYWKHGAITVSGDVLLMYYFHELLELYAQKSNFDLLQIAQIAKKMYINDRKPSNQATGVAFLSIFSFGKVELITLSIEETEIEYETIAPMNAHFSMFAGTPDDPIYQNFVDALRCIGNFPSFKAFFEYHVDLIKAFYKRQKSFNESITARFDLFIQNTQTAYGLIHTITNLD